MKDDGTIYDKPIGGDKNDPPCYPNVLNNLLRTIYESGFKNPDEFFDYLLTFDGDLHKIQNSNLKRLIIRLTEKGYLPLD